MTGVAEANPELLSARNILYGVWKSAYDPPVWFIKTLFELILISPLVWGIANKLKQKTVVLVIFIALSVIGFTPGYTSILFWIPLYLLAATIACCKNDMISHFSMTRSYLCVVLYCSFIFPLRFGASWTLSGARGSSSAGTQCTATVKMNRTKIDWW